MNLRFDLLCDISNKDTPSDSSSIQIKNESEYIDGFCSLSNVQNEFAVLEESFNNSVRAYKFLEHHKVDNAIYNVLCDQFGLEEIVGLPRNCINASNQAAYNVVCLEGMGSFIKDICKRIWEFFMNLYRTVMNFFGIRSFRHRKLESELIRIQRAVEGMGESEFGTINRSEFKSNVPVMNVRVLDTLYTDMEDMYNTLMSVKDVEKISGLVNATSGLLTRLGYQIVQEYHISDPSALPYEEFKKGETIKAEELGFHGKGDVIQRINRVLKIQKTLLDLERWYPANLKKYAARAEVAAKSTGSNAQTAIQNLNEEQKCQAYECKYIVIYMTLVDFLCARTIASCGIFANK